MKLLKSKKGLTLVEVIFALFILAIIFGMIASIVGFFSGFFGDETQQLNRQENMRLLMLNIEKDIRTSDQVIDFSGDCYIIGLGDGTTTSHEYCFIEESLQVTRDGVIVARNVATFDLDTTDGSIIIVDIKMFPDLRGIIVEAEYTIYLRQAGS